MILAAKDQQRKYRGKKNRYFENYDKELLPNYLGKDVMRIEGRKLSPKFIGSFEILY